MISTSLQRRVFDCTLNATDILTGWTESVGVWGKGQERVGGAVDAIRRRLPFPLLGLDSDNGGEFINYGLYDYCQRHKITFTRSRAYKKNDQAHVEQSKTRLRREELDSSAPSSGL